MRISSTVAVSLIAAVVLVSAARADELAPTDVFVDGIGPGTEVVVTLSTGETLRGVLLERSDTTIVFEHPALGRVEIPAASASLKSADAVADVVEQEAEPAAEQRSPWSGEFEAGADGAHGNSKTMNIRIAASTGRKTESSKLSISSSYRFAGDSGSTSENRVVNDIRHDWLYGDSPWQYFASTHFDADEDKDYDARVSVATGPAYQIIDRQVTSLLGSLGFGATYDIGAEDDSLSDVRLELSGLVDFAHAFSARNSMKLSAGAFPDLTDPGEFRITSNARWDYKLTGDPPVLLRFNVENRYDSNPSDDDKNNDLEYNASIVYEW